MKTKPKSMTSTLIIINLICFLLFSNAYIFGASNDSVIHNFQIYRLITCLFAHAGVTHLMCNMLSLLMIGTVVESMMRDSKKFLISYLFCGVVGALVSIILNHGITTVGASGAIYGLYGILLGNSNGDKQTLISGLIFLVIMGLLAPNIDIIGHLAGFATGFFLGKQMGH